MAFQSGFTASLIINGKSQRELNESGDRTVRIPFGSEYAIRIKNKTKGRAYVSVDIDGTDVLGGKLIIRAGQTIDLERFVVDGDLSKGKRFKFVSAGHGDVQDPTSEENGLICVKIEPEMIFSYTNATYMQQGYGGVLRNYTNPTLGGSSILRSASFGGSGTGGAGTSFSISTNAMAGNSSTVSLNAQPVGCVMDYNSNPVTSDVGATVEGSVSHQQFQASYEAFATTFPVNIDIRIKGPKVENVVVQQWYEFELMGRKAKSVLPLNMINQKIMGDAALAIAQAEVRGQPISTLTILADSVQVA